MAATILPLVPAANRLVQDVIRDQAMARPYAPAICSANVYLTYQELDQLSSRLATHIGTFWIRPDSIVPIIFDKSATTIIAMLAVLKAGGAFTALDISHPDERLSEIIKSTKASVLLASPAQASRFSGIPGLSVIEVSNDMLASLTAPQEPPAARLDASPENLMYVIFTSGSTGRPKGVMIEHRAWLNSALAYGSDQGLSPQSRVLQFASYAFDMSLMEIFTTLIFGGCVCVPADEDRFGKIEDFVNKTGVNTLMLTPSYAKLLDPATMPSVHTFITGGEAVPSDLLEKWNLLVEVYIAYGPTEASIQAAGAKLEIGSSVAPSGLVGHSTGCNLWIVSEENHDELVSQGETGELLIEGHTLARGYLDDEEKTNAAFVDVQVGSNTRRMFKTGDLVRQMADGNIVFVGRKDTQVKVQGQRFELTEIEARLAPILPPGSKVCVDKVESPASPSQAFLVAFVSTSMKLSDDEQSEICWRHVEETREQVPEIMASLAKVLHAPMIPSVYVPVTFIPLTTSHKTDRKSLRGLVERLSFNDLEKLRKPNETGGETRTLSSSELTLRELWALVLNRRPETIGPDDNFIQLGGDSVTSIKLISVARNQGITLTSATVLSTPVLSEQAQKLSMSNGSGQQKSIQPFGLLEGRADELRGTAVAICRLPPENIEDVLPMTLSQMRWYGKTLVKPTAWLDQYHFTLPEDVDLARFNSALNSAIQAAELLRARVIATSDRKLFQTIAKHHPVEVVEVQDSLEAYLSRDLETPMGLGAPLSRYAHVKTPDSAKVFVWTIHHAIYDGYSLPMLLQFIEDSYQGLKPASFTPFSHYLQGPSEDELVEGEAFWKQYLSETSWTKFPALPPPGEKSAPSMDRLLRTFSLISREQPDSTAEGTASITTANVIRVAYAATLSHYAEAQDTPVLFLESLGGRNSTLAGIDRVAGPTLLTIPTRLHLASSKSCGEVLSEAQTSLVARMKYENFPLLRLLPLAPALELRNVLMIEDEAFLINGAGEGLFGRGNEELKLDETEGLPMIFRCTIHRGAVDVDIRYDEQVLTRAEVEALLETFRRVFEELWLGDRSRSFDSVLQ
ncbi:Uu.00g073900.m01.CDS01 [Anthostomella pinea]|uniref:Uu.00g073900.m01.CDS01 n=1 Tax=Anthostomella pinea TaxID=933095 RepID=A0AAI8YP16_9PEZI|nr:Uu.00g073900.m01.CDS01 [Anthostomella pinea]